MQLSTYPDGEGYVVAVTGELTAEEPLAQLPQTVERILREKAPSVVGRDAH